MHTHTHKHTHTHTRALRRRGVPDSLAFPLVQVREELKGCMADVAALQALQLDMPSLRACAGDGDLLDRSMPAGQGTRLGLRPAREPPSMNPRTHSPSRPTTPPPPSPAADDSAAAAGAAAHNAGTTDRSGRPGSGGGREEAERRAESALAAEGGEAMHDTMLATAIGARLGSLLVVLPMCSSANIFLVVVPIF